MACSRLVFSLLVLSVVQCYASVPVPVFLWGILSKPSLKSYPMMTISDQEFDSLLKREIKGNPFTVVFVEDTLSVEDFSRKNAEGETLYPYLHANLGKAVYIPSVDNPLDGLSTIAGDNVNYIRLTEDGLTANIEPEAGNYLFINLKDAKEGESRSDLLRRHNDFMQKTINDLQTKYDNIVAVYTGENPLWTVTDDDEAIRVRRQAEAPAANEPTAIVFPSMLMYVQKLLVNNVDIRPDYASGTSVVDEGRTTQNSTLTFKDYSLTLRFKHQGGYWIFDTIGLTKTGDSITEELSPVESIYALYGDSYRCQPNMTFTTTLNVTTPYLLVFQDTMFQPYFNTTIPTDNLEFGETFNCVGFFTIPIWAGLFVVTILLTIMFIGIIMMFDIRTMDRFDDPKGKTITINPMDQ